MTLKELRSKFENVQRDLARCPVHGDFGRDLVIAKGKTGRLRVRCFHGCSPKEILAKVGLRPRDLEPEKSSRSSAGSTSRSASKNSTEAAPPELDIQGEIDEPMPEEPASFSPESGEFIGAITAIRRSGVAEPMALEIAQALALGMGKTWKRERVANAVAVVYRTLGGSNHEAEPAATTTSKATGEPPGETYSIGWAAGEFARLHGDQVRFLREPEEWIAYDGVRWKPDLLTVERLAIDFFDSLLRQGLDSKNPALKKFAVLASARPVRDLLFLARSHPAVAGSIEDFDKPEKCAFLLNVANGTIDLKTGELRPHDRADFITKLAPVAFDPAATCPRFDRFLEEIYQGDMELTAYHWRRFGYCLTGSTAEQVFFVNFGGGANGKSTAAEIENGTLGDYAMTANIATFCSSRFDRSAGEASPHLAALKGARLVSAVEPKLSAVLDESKVKQIVGGDPVRARHLHQEEFTFRPTCKLVLAVNNRPRVRDGSEGMWRRLRLIPFEARFQGKRRDPELLEKLKIELPGILAAAVRGALEWQKGGLRDPEKVLAATAAYRQDEDQIARFLEACTDRRKGARVAYADLWKRYLIWIESEGERPTTRRPFGDALTRLGVLRSRTGGIVYCEDIELAEGGHPTPEQDDQDELLGFSSNARIGKNTFTSSCSSYPNTPGGGNGDHPPACDTYRPGPEGTVGCLDCGGPAREHPLGFA
jgi:P4 family phage/plasmid primase-like protien